MSNNEEKSFEEKIEEAKKLLTQLIDPEITLSNSVDVYKKGMKELELAQKLLDEAKLNFQELNKENL
ncbi:MAG: exodeoxyribonuclease VII small subunit [Campylobacteraceae bacterium]|nr:exodeoxyribonuclease VII small subunit [Campylobacteraceae bacterium]